MTGNTVLRVDVWGGEDSMDHVARRHLDLSTSWEDEVRREVAAGFLVNLRMLGPGGGWGPDADFDDRAPAQAGRA